MFIGRERELAAMEKLYKKEAFQLVVLYGRRRIGKTTLISKFIEGKPYNVPIKNDTELKNEV